MFTINFASGSMLQKSIFLTPIDWWGPLHGEARWHSGRLWSRMRNMSGSQLPVSPNTSCRLGLGCSIHWGLNKWTSRAWPWRDVFWIWGGAWGEKRRNIKNNNLCITYNSISFFFFFGHKNLNIKSVGFKMIMCLTDPSHSNAHNTTAPHPELKPTRYGHRPPSSAWTRSWGAGPTSRLAVSQIGFPFSFLAISFNFFVYSLYFSFLFFVFYFYF